MKSRYELPFSTSYVPDWTYIEAFRELFQNALDNEITNPDNKMIFDFNPETGTIKICNKTSTLELDSLLLGSTTKANDADTIGQHGEGYKIAFLVLLREGKKVTVYNYGKREVWNTRLVKSKRYNGQLVPVITVDREVFWKQIPDHDLTIEVKGITQAEYDSIVKKNLNLQDDVESYKVPSYGEILTDKSEKGNLYVKGLYVCNNDRISFGYNFEPSMINLDRDRKLIQSFDLLWNTSTMWKIAFNNKFMVNEILDMINDGVEDIRYIESIGQYSVSNENIESDIANAIAVKFTRKYGENAVPVTENSELSAVTNGRPVIVNPIVSSYLSKATRVEILRPVKEENIADKLESFIAKIENKLSDEELEEAGQILERVKRLLG